MSMLDEEYQQDFAKLMEWTNNVEAFEEDIMDLLKCQHEDEIKVKALHR